MEMLRLAAALIISIGAARAQRLTWYEKLLLLEAPRNVSGVVLDESGKPLSGAHIDHSDLQAREQLFTDDNGRFQFRTRAPAIVIRKLGYDGQLVKTGSAQPLRVILRHAARPVPRCTADCRSLGAGPSSFCFPSIPGVRIGDQGRYEDTFVRAFTFESGERTTELLHGAGPAWTLGIPYTGDVWEAVQYSERALSADGSDIVDARGVAPNGRRWRYLGRFGESAAYYEADTSTAAILNRVLDGVCIAIKDKPRR